jgi:hypothetical protein
MTAIDLLRTLQASGVRLCQTGDQLQVVAPPGALTNDLKAALRERKADLIALIRDQRLAASLALEGTLQAMAMRWDRHRAAAETASRELGRIEDQHLTAAVGDAIRAADLDRAEAAIPRCKAEPPLSSASTLPVRDLNRWLDSVDLGCQEAASREVLARADQILGEIDGLRPPPNPSVHRMFDEARRRFGYRDVEERSMTVWIRKNAPAVAALWPEAPVDASWYHWRRKVGPDHNEVLDRAFAHRQELYVGPDPPPRKPKAKETRS